MSAIDDLELSIQQHKEAIRRGHTLQRLMKYPEFKEIILNGYLEKEAIRLVHLKSAHRTQNPVDQEAITKRIDAVGILKHYLDSILYEHDQAIKDIEMDTNTLEDILREEANQ